MRRALSFLSLASGLASGCAESRKAEDPDGWYADGGALDVTESMSFTTDPYGIDGGIGDLYGAILPVPGDGAAFAPGDEFGGNVDCDAAVDDELPREIEGIVTIYPRFYFKTIGCTNDDEKFYGSFFIEDDTGGLFVLGDSKVAHFTAGDRVRMRIRGVRSRYDLDMAYAWDIVEVDHASRPIRYEAATEAFGPDDVAKVRRVSGEVTTAPDTFGAFSITSDEGVAYALQFDSELNRRGLEFDVGSRVEATGPILYSFSAYTLIIMSVGQVTSLD